MGKFFHHHATNDLIRISDGTLTYVDAGDSFVTDGGAKPSLPVGAIERIYEPGVRHAISNGSVVIAGGPQSWPFGDAVIAKVAGLLAAQAKRSIPPPKSPAPAPQPNKTGKSNGTATMAN